jgi:glycosyltransferase involved in cell wall biosynthesis
MEARRMRRILHINDYPTEAGGGAEVMLAQSLSLLRARGLSAESFTCADLADARRTVFRYIHNSNACAALAKTLERFQPDVVHLHNYYHILSPGILSTLAHFKKRKPLRVVMTAHDYHLRCPNSGGSWFYFPGGERKDFDGERMASLRYLLTRSWDQRGWLFSGLKTMQHLWSYRWRQLQRVIDMVICPSRFMQRLIDQAGLPSCWLPHPLPALGRAKVKRSDALQLVFAGRLEPEKGLHEFLQDWPIDLNAELNVIGAGDERTRCEQTCALRGLTERVRFLGWLPRNETIAQIARAHVLVLPTRVLESYGLVLLEALATGTNVLAANRGAVREIIESAGVGFLYDLDNRESLHQQLRHMQASHRDGSLNRFDLSAFLADRSETRYVEGLMRAYAIGESTMRLAS